jgi:hypothetical protein
MTDETGENIDPTIKEALDERIDWINAAQTWFARTGPSRSAP